VYKLRTFPFGSERYRFRQSLHRHLSWQSHRQARSEANARLYVSPPSLQLLNVTSYAITDAVAVEWQHVHPDQQYHAVSECRYVVGSVDIVGLAFAGTSFAS
jgi:hypothetical protein